MTPGDATSFLKGLAMRSELIELPLGVFRVAVARCSGKGECADACPVNVFERDERGRCTVVNEALCYGCMACLAQCQDNGVEIEPASSACLSPEELLR
jgi:NAD-dependent dihydropyrimidine dehydrogenase PreA subunit